MTRFALTLAATALFGSAAFAQIDDVDLDPPITPAGAGMLADADGDGIVNHDDADFVRPDYGRGNRMGPAEFIDADGDGINDLAPDADGDGIVNHLDDDYMRTPANLMGGNGRGAMGFVDEDGDGINDRALDADGDGIVNHLDDDFVRTFAADGTQGNGMRGSGMRGNAQAPGTGECTTDGTSAIADRQVTGRTGRGTDSTTRGRGRR